VPLPSPHPLAAYGASILASSALDLRPPYVPVALTPMAGQSNLTRGRIAPRTIRANVSSQKPFGLQRVNIKRSAQH